MFDRNLMKLKGMPAVLGALVVFALIQALLIIGQANFISEALSNLWMGTEIASCAFPVCAFLICFLAIRLLRLIRENFLDSYSVKTAESLRSAVLEGVFDPDRMLARSVGATNVATSALDGIDEIQTYIRVIPPKIIDLVGISIPVLIATFVYDWISGVILTVMFPVTIFFMVLLGKQARARAERQYVAYTRLSNRFMDTLRGMEAIVASGADESEAAHVFSFSERLRHATVKTLTTATLSSAVLELCSTFGVAAVSIMLAFRLMDGSIALYTGLCALILAPEYFAPIRGFAGDFHASLDGRNALTALMGMMDVAAHKDDAPLPKSADSTTLLEWGPGSTLEFHDVGFTYTDGNEPALKGISACFKAGQKVAIIGKSGSGKTTLANLLAGFSAHSAGTIRVNSTEANLVNEDWRRHVRYIPQHPSIFRMSLEDNIRFYNPEAPQSVVDAAVDAVGLRELVEELPEGICTVIGDGNRALSGGQAHRIALARVLVDPEAHILIFDEPTAHLDIETEYELKQNMLPLMQDKLVIFATHRHHWVADMDRVIVLDCGEVVKDEVVCR